MLLNAKLHKLSSNLVTGVFTSVSFGVIYAYRPHMVSVLRSLWRSRMYRTMRFALALISSIGLVSKSHSYFNISNERILSFDSVITIQKDASISIAETITVLSEGKEIKRGITREFPTKYKDRFGNNYNVGFNVEKITVGGKTVPYFLSDAVNGKIIYVGDRNKILPPGKYAYTIYYNTNRQLGFFKNHDELYWNVTGNGSKFPIDSVTAKVILPAGIKKDDIKLEAYTGYFGQTGRDYSSKVEDDNTVTFSTTRKLAPREGLTIVVTWPKGFITEPGFFTKARYFFQDNWNMLLLCFGLLALILFYFLVWLRFKREQEKGVIIPLFGPPDDMLPGAVRYLHQMHYDAKVFACEIVNMAVHGFLAIKYEEKKGILSWLSSNPGVYTLIRNAEADNAPEPYKTVLKTLFSKSSVVPIDSYNAATIDSAQTRYFLKAHLGAKYLKSYEWALIIGGAFAFTLLIITFSNLNLLTAIFFGLYIFIIAVAHKLLKGHTPQGRKLMDSIEGFKLFLETTETDRLKIIGTPPTKNPELYEKYLPYAMALDVESQWSKQFVPVFEKLKNKGTPYVPIWFHGPRFTHFNSASLSSNITSALSAISASSSAPGTSSGSGGRGSSGGGGGGGGVGGW